MSEVNINVVIDSLENPKPIFEIITESNNYRIYSNGFVEGFDKTNKCMIINRIPQVILEAKRNGR